MNSFYINEEPTTKDKYYISVLIVIYRAKLGKYPEFLSNFETARNKQEGYPTKFCYCTEHVMLNKEEAEKLYKELETKYGRQLRLCEETGDWSNSPLNFEKMDLLWSK